MGTGIQDFDNILSSEKGKALRGLAGSEEAKRLSKLVDAKSVEKAAAEGDMDALRAVLASVLKTDEGKKLAEKIRNL